VRPDRDHVLHFSEDPGITRFEPHVAATAQQPEAYVWAVDALHAPSYWFPRQCPRAMAWVVDGTTDADRDAILGPGGGERVHAIEWGWLEAVRTCRLFAYRFAIGPFTPLGDGHAWVASTVVEPVGPPEPVGDLLDLHRRAGIQLRVLPELWRFWDAVVASTLGWGGIRLGNAHPRPS
jgi:hypothetical protein